MPPRCARVPAVRPTYHGRPRAPQLGKTLPTRADGLPDSHEHGQRQGGSGDPQRMQPHPERAREHQHQNQNQNQNPGRCDGAVHPDAHAPHDAENDRENQGNIGQADVGTHEGECTAAAATTATTGPGNRRAPIRASGPIRAKTTARNHPIRARLGRSESGSGPGPRIMSNRSKPPRPRPGQHGHRRHLDQKEDHHEQPQSNGPRHAVPVPAVLPVWWHGLMLLPCAGRRIRPRKYLPATRRS